MNRSGMMVTILAGMAVLSAQGGDRLAPPGAAAPGAAAPAEKYVVCKIFDHSHVATYEVKSMTDLKTLKNEIDQENKAFGRALAITDREWKKNKDNTGTFPRSAISQREVKEMGTYSSDAEANKKMAILQERDVKDPDDNKKQGTKKEDKEDAKRKAGRTQAGTGSGRHAVHREAQGSYGGSSSRGHRRKEAGSGPQVDRSQHPHDPCDFVVGREMSGVLLRRDVDDLLRAAVNQGQPVIVRVRSAGCAALDGTAQETLLLVSGSVQVRNRHSVIRTLRQDQRLSVAFHPLCRQAGRVRAGFKPGDHRSDRHNPGNRRVLRCRR